MSKPGEILSILDVVYLLTEIFEVASRLATTNLYHDERSIVIDLTLCNLQNRQLYGRGTQIVVPIQGQIRFKELPHILTLAKEDIISRSRELALKEAQYIFERFQWYPSTELLATLQSQITLDR